MLKREGCRIMQVMILGVLIATLVLCLPVAAKPVVITGPTVITAPGTYILTKDIIASSAVRCIEIKVPNVTLDGQGHLISGIGKSGSSGVYVTESMVNAGPGSVVIRGVKVKNWDQGITIYRTKTSIEQCTATGNKQGITLQFASGTTITGSTASNNVRMGFNLYDTTRAFITGNTLIGNYAGIGLLSSPEGTISGNSITNNTIGVVAESSPRPTIRNNLFTRNGEAITISHSEGAIINGNRIIPRSR